MNMKKTIAALAACAVAVSAMATTVSAINDGTYTYNLVRTTKVTDAKGTAVYSYVIKNVDTTATVALDITGFTNATATYGTVKNVVVYVDYETAATSAGAERSVLRYSNGDALGFQNAAAQITAGTITIAADSLDATQNTTAQFTVEVTVEHPYDKGDNAALKTVPAITIASAPASYAVLKATTDKTEKEIKKPFMSNLYGGDGDIIEYLQEYDLRNNENPYYNVKAVLNDAIENFDSVTFTFATAKEPVNAAGEYDKDGDKTYLAFDEHLYTYFWYDEETTWTGFNWAGTNLFNGALVINEELTMSLADTEKFDYAKTTLSFDWDTVEEGAATNNSYARYIHTLKLATSSRWYWDSLTVTCTNAAEEDTVDTEAPTTSDDEELGEEEAEEETEEVTEEAETEEEAEVEVENPTTGNASVALAVIPVALAAAAVVAKKRS
jgi:hypothetical protein